MLNHPAPLIKLTPHIARQDPISNLADTHLRHVESFRWSFRGHFHRYDAGSFCMSSGSAAGIIFLAYGTFGKSDLGIADHLFFCQNHLQT